MVVPEFLGRFSNNIWQVSAAIGYASKHKTNFAIPKGYHHKDIYNFFPSLPIFDGDLSSWHKYDKANDYGFAYKEIPKFNGNIKIRGYWQSVKFFEHCQDEVRSILKLKETPVDYVGIHVRRGDYLQYPNQFPAITPKYLVEAIKVFTDKRYNDFLVFSDDQEWCKVALPKLAPGVNFKFATGNVYEDISLMSSCEHNIISNSSLSLFAAWYNRNENKIVVSPSKETWFGKALQGIDTSTLIPDNFIQIHTR